MRLHFPNLSRPKKASKHIAARLGMPLSVCQNGVARACGYRDWHDLAATQASEPTTVLDQEISHSDFIKRHVELSLALAEALQASDGDTQAALAQSRLIGDRVVTLADQLEIRLACWRQTTLGLSGRRERGAVGTLKSSGRNGEAVILRSYGRPTWIITERSVGTVADFEFVSPRNPRPLFLPMRLYLPYGYWIESDGARVLFSRDYKPIWRIRNNVPPERMEPWLYIAHLDQVFLWDDGHTPWGDPSIRKALEAYLMEVGIQTLPILADALPLLINNDNAGDMSDGAELLQKSRIHRTAVAAE